MAPLTDPLVSIGLPVFNEERHLAEALDHLLAQDYSNLEILISDNDSEDDTAAICELYAARDGRIRYRRSEKNHGGVANFNLVVGLARGQYFTWASGHDLRDPAFVSRCVEVLEEDRSVVLAYPGAVWIDEFGQELEPLRGIVDTRGLKHPIWRYNTVLWGLVDGFPIYGVMRLDALRRSRMYRNVVSPDVALLAELALLGAFAYVPRLLLRMRKPADYGDWEVYLGKHFARSRGWRAQALYWRMLADLLRSSIGHTREPHWKLIGASSTMLCMSTKYRWMLTGLLPLRRRRSGQ